MSMIIDTLAADLEFLDGGRSTLGGTPLDPRFSLPAGGRYWAVDDGIEITRSRSLWDMQIDSNGLSTSRYSVFSIGPGPDGDPILLLTRKLSFDTPSGLRNVIFYAGFPQGEMQLALNNFRYELARMLALTALMLLLAAVLQILLGLRPLEELQSQVARLRTGAVERLSSKGPIEVRALVSEINELLREKATAVERARARAADLAHGLKTPLTAILQVAETLPPATGGLIIEHVEVIRRRSDRQLLRARLAVGQKSGGEDFKVFATKLVRVISAIPVDRQIDWRIEVADRLAVPVDSADLAEAVGNILDNARKWASSLVCLKAERRGSKLNIEIADDGFGIAIGDRKRILARGMHTNDPQSETGLGLSIACEIVEAYGGSLSLAPAEIGGLKVTIELPGSTSTCVQNPSTH